MDRNELREIHHSIGEIESHLQDIHSTLASDPDFKEITRPMKKFGGKKFGRKKARLSPDHTETGKAPGKKGKRRKDKKRDWKDGDAPWDPGVRFRDSRRKPPYVIINLPAKQHRKVNRERIPVPVGQKWVHAGCNVFVRRDVYQCFTKVRDVLSEQMSASFEGNWND